MGAVLDQLRNWRERHPDAQDTDWRAAQGNGWRTDGTRNAMDHMEAEAAALVDAGQPSIDRDRLNNTPAVRRVGNVSPDLFIERRPRGDRLVYVLLRELTGLNPDAGKAGLVWYEAHRTNLTVDQGSDWITRIRAKIAEGAVTAAAPHVEAVVPRKSNVWAEWRALCVEVLSAVDCVDDGARFAVRNNDGGDNDYAFWCIVNRPGAAGNTRYFLRQYLGGQGMVRVTMRPEAMVTIARRIRDAGPREAMLKFGELLGRCGDCGRTLTNQESRTLRVGPVCRGKHAWL